MIILPIAVLCLINISLIGDRDKLIDPLGVAQKKRLSLKELGHHIKSKCTIYITIQVTVPQIL